MKPLNPARRALFAPGLMSLLAPSLLAATNTPDQDITVGALLSLTGDWSDLGKQCKLMMEIAAADLEASLALYNASTTKAGVRFNLIIEDTQLDPQKAAAAASRLISRGAQFIIGPQSSSEVREVKKVTDAAGVVQVSPGSTASALAFPNDSVFRFVPADTLESKSVAQVAASEGIKVMVPLWRADDGNRGLVNSLRQFGPAAGIEVTPGVEYPVTGAAFAQIAEELAGTMTTLQNRYSMDQIAVYLAAFDEGADFLGQAIARPSLRAVKWYAGDGVALSTAYLAPAAASFIQITRLVAPLPALPVATQVLRDPIVQKLTAAGVTSPLAYAFAGYDAFACCAMALLLSGNDRANVGKVLAQVARNYMGTTGWTLLNAAGDRAIADFQYYGIVNDAGTWTWKPLFEHEVS